MRALAAVLLASLLSVPASAKVLCPPGDFVLRALREPVPEPLRSGLVLRLGEGRADLAGLCPAVGSVSFHEPTGSWLQARVRWPRCSRPRSAALRAFFAFDAPPCTRLAGRLRLGPKRYRVVADRVPVCGNRVRDPGEQCDGPDPRFGDCCDAGCRALADCPVRCDEHFACEPGEACVVACRVGGQCETRATLDCGTTPVCACDGTTTFPDRCAAVDAGAAIAYSGSCLPR